MAKPYESQGTNRLIDKCDALYVWHKDAIYRMALRAVGGDEAWALAVLEKCMMIAYNNIDKFDDEKSEHSKSVMTAILQTQINEIYRALLQKAGLFEADQNVKLTEKDKFDANQILIRNDLTADLAKYVDKLTNTEKELVFMRYFMGFTEEELSGQYGIKPEEVGKRVFLVKQKIAQMMRGR
jgi:RNA polymerase sigma factor (sigma-70 family)